MDLRLSDQIKELTNKLSQQATATELYQLADKPLFFLKDANVASKNFNDWRRAGLWYDESSEKRTWAKLNLEQYIWLKMLQQMRQLGLPTELILKVKQQLITPLELEVLLKNYKKALVDNAKDPKKKKELLASFKNGEFLKTFLETEEGKELSKPQTKLRSYLYAALSMHQHFAILIYPKGIVIPWMDQFFQMQPWLEKLLKRSHLYISVTEHLMEFLSDPEKEPFLSPLMLLSEEEKQVLSAIRDNTLKELLIILPKDQNSRKVAKQLITAKSGFLQQEDEEMILEILMHKKYQSMELKKRNGNKFYFERQNQEEL